MKIEFNQPKREAHTKVISEIISGQPTEVDGCFIFPLLSPGADGKLTPVAGIKVALTENPDTATLRLSVKSLRYGNEGIIEEISLNDDVVDLKQWAANAGISLTNENEITLTAIANPKAKI